MKKDRGVIVRFKLQKRLDDKKERLFYVVVDTVSKNYLDIFEFKRFEVCPTLERTVFKQFVQVFNALFEDEQYDYLTLRANMFVLNGIDITKDVIKNIEYKTSFILKRLYNSIRWQDAYNLINCFRAKISLEGVESLRQYILNKDYSYFSKETKENFNDLVKNINFTGNEALLFKEVLEVCMYDERKKAINKLTPLLKRLDKLEEEINNSDGDYLTDKQAKEFREIEELLNNHDDNF